MNYIMKILVIFATVAGCSENADLPLHKTRSGEVELEPLKYTGDAHGVGIIEFKLNNPFSFAISVVITSIDNHIGEVGTEFVKIPSGGSQKMRFSTMSQLYIYDDKGVIIGLINPKNALR